MTVCSYCAYYGSTTPNPSARHLASHPINAVAIPKENAR